MGSVKSIKGEAYNNVISTFYKFTNVIYKHVSHEILSYFPKWDANVIDSLTFVSIAFLFAEMNSI